LFLLLKRLKTFVFGLRSWRFLFLLLEKLKAFAFAFKCWRFLLIFLDVEGSYFYFLMLNVIILGCSKFLLLVLDVESFCSYSWILKVLTFVLRCCRFLFLFLDVEGFCFLMLKVFIFILGCWRFVYLHILKKHYVKIYSILFKSWLYKFNLIYNDEIFMKGDFLMIIMLHMFYFVFKHLWWLLLFLCYKVKLSLCSNLWTSKLFIQGKIILKIPKIIIQFTWL